MALRIYTIGHSTRTAEEFVSLLREFGVVQLADIRQYPGSRRLPQFGREALSDCLVHAGIRYEWLQALGGRRPATLADSPNVGLRHPAFRNYADYMLTPEFRAAIDNLLALAGEGPTAIMCAEAVYWRCHRRLVSDYIVTHGVDVQHIMGHRQIKPHMLTPGATVRNGQLVYLPAEIATSARDCTETGTLFNQGSCDPSHTITRVARPRGPGRPA